MNTLTGLRHGLLHLFYPRLCVGCGSALIAAEQVLCLGCGAEIPRTSFHNIKDNDATLRIAGRVPFLFATAFAWFTAEGMLQHLLHALKYKGNKEAGLYLGRQLGYDLKDVTWADTIDAIVPVPLHPKKEAARGYNQSSIIAEGLSDVLDRPVLASGLRRTRHTESQTKKTRTERIANVADAFAAGSNDLKGKHVLLIDDVLTTGATLESAANSLINDCGAQVSIATIGIAVS